MSKTSFQNIAFGILLGLLIFWLATSEFWTGSGVMIRPEGDNADMANWEPAFTDGGPELWELAERKDTTLYQRALWELKRREGYRDTVYTCPAGYLTIGWGMQIAFNDVENLPTKHAQQLALRTRFLKDFEYVQARYRGYTRNQYLAMALLRFNIGKFGENLDRCLLENKQLEAIAWWQKYVVYRKYNPKTGKKEKKESPNLHKARAFEIALFTGKYGA